MADELLTRDLGAIPEADRAQLESLAVLYASTNFMPWEHFLQLIDTGNGNGVLDADATGGSCVPWWTMTSCGKPLIQLQHSKKQGYQAIERSCGRWWEPTKLTASFTWVRQLRGIVKRVATSARHVAGRPLRLTYHR